MKNHHPYTHRRSGMTLIEIVAVLVIVSVLSGISVQNYRRVQVKAEAARIATELHYLEDAVIAARSISSASVKAMSPASTPSVANWLISLA